MWKVALRIPALFLCALLINPTLVFGYDRLIEEGRTVKIDYTLRVDGQVIESTVGKDPLTYQHGEGKIIPGLAKALIGLKEGDRKTVIIPSAAAYGADEEENYRRVDKTTMPEGFEPEQGMVIDLANPEGNDPLSAIVWEVAKDDVLLNFNHPLAGKDLEFDVVILSIR